ncbi:MAG: ISL3 family transposase [Anaerolineales bacterium]|nr:ISL3 family transposase [Anaerolineales bacterium]
MNIDNVPLLPALVNRAKDAARAVKDGVHVVIRQVTDNTLTLLLDLLHFAVSDYAIEKDAQGDILHLFCHLTVEVGICPHCQAVSSDIKQYKERCVRDHDIWGKRTFLHFQIRRFECPDCGLRFTEELAAVGWRRRQTTRFEQVVYQQCCHSSKKETAEQFHLSQTTVAGIFNQWANRRIESPRQQVRVLGMDEIALKKRHKQYVLVLSDLEQRCVLAVLPTREQKTLIAWLQTFTKAEKRAIQVVSMDMWRPYRSVVSTYLPHADIVADRFHVMKQLNEQLTKARRQIQRRADTDTKEALKGSRWLLVRAGNSLTAEQSQQLQLALDADPVLRTAYLLKEEFYLIFERLRDREQARRFLMAWIVKVQQTNNRYLLAFVKTLRNWWQQILNYFDERITNGFVEGMNRAIRAIIWRAYGFRNFDNFRLQILAELGFPSQDTIW